MLTFRRVRAGDAPPLAVIQNHYVLHSTASFYYEPLDAAFFIEKIAAIAPHHPFIVCEKDGVIAGFAYAAPIHPQQAYWWSVELTIYLAPDVLHEGVGSALYSRLLALLRQLGYLNAYACITAENDASIRFHERFGFRQIGHFPQAGLKNDRWLDIVWLATPLASPLPASPEPPVPFGSIPDDALAAILQ